MFCGHIRESGEVGLSIAAATRDDDNGEGQHIHAVDRASGDPKTGWALAPAGIRGVQATVFYLERLAKLEEAWAMAIKPSDRGLTN